MVEPTGFNDGLDIGESEEPRRESMAVRFSAWSTEMEVPQTERGQTQRSRLGGGEGDPGALLEMW